MRVVEAGLRRFALPLVAPLATAHGAVEARIGWLVSLTDEAGRVGIGEATPLPSFGGEDLASCRTALRRALAASNAGAAAMTRACVGAPCARAALEAALADLAAQRAGLSLAAWLRRAAGLPGAPAAHVRVQALVGGGEPEAVAASARRARERGFEVFKLKLAVGPALRDPGRDVERVAALREAVGASARIRLDANEAWSRAEAEAALARLAPFAIEFVEQPVARDALAALAALDRDGPIPIAADESLLDDRIEACLAGRIAGVFVVKQSILGGLPAALALAARARAQGIRLVHSNLFEGRVGRATAVSLAAALAERDDEVHGLGTAEWLARDFDAPVFETGSPARLATPTGPGLGARAGLRAELPAALTPGADRVFRSTGWLARTADRHFERSALVADGEAVHYGELAAAARALGESLAGCGLAAGSLAAVLAAPSSAGVVLVHALLERGIVLLPLNTRLTESELDAALETTRPAVLFVAAASDAERARGRRLAREAGCELLFFGGEGAPQPGSGLGCAIRVEPAVASEATAASSGACSDEGASALPSSGSLPRRRTPRDPAVLRDARAALVLLTSGTSGRPKAAVLTLDQLIASAEASAALLGSRAEDRWLLCMPLFHIAGLSILVRAALAGAGVWLEPRFDAARIAGVIDEASISHVSLVATTLAQLLDARARALAPRVEDPPAAPSLRLVLIGGGPASDALLARATAAGYPIAPTYGLTEAASQVATRPPALRAPAGAHAGEDRSRARAGLAHAVDVSPGAGLVALPGVSLRIVDEAGRVVAAGCEGGIEVRGPTVMAGYLDDPAATAAVLRAGWLATGDVGSLDSAGRLTVLDRRADLIVSGGENVYPAEIESVLADCPDLVEAGVVGVADERFGARPLAFVVWRSGVVPDPARLEDFCRERLAGYKVPVDFVAVESLPRNAAGKLLRRALTLPRS